MNLGIITNKYKSDKQAKYTFNNLKLFSGWEEKDNLCFKTIRHDLNTVEPYKKNCDIVIPQVFL